MAPYPDYKISMPGDFMRTTTASLTNYAEQMRYETLQYNYATMGYDTERQARKIRELESKLEEKERKKENDLQSIIGYFYQRSPRIA